MINHQVHCDAEVLIEATVLLIVTMYILILELIPLISTFRIRKFWLLCVAGIFSFGPFNFYIFVFSVLS